MGISRTVRKIGTQTDSPNFAYRTSSFHDGPRAESWVQCLLDESFPSTPPRNYDHRSPIEVYRSPPCNITSPLLSSSCLAFCSILIPKSLRRALITSLKMHLRTDKTYISKEHVHTHKRPSNIWITKWHDQIRTVDIFVLKCYRRRHYPLRTTIRYHNDP